FRRYPMAELQKKRGVQPLFDSMFSYTNFHIYGSLGDRIKVLSEDVFEQTNFPLAALFSSSISGKELSLNLHYAVPAFSREQAEAISHYYQIALLQIARNPSARYELESLLTPAEQYCLVIEWNNTESQYQKDACVSQLFEEQVKIVPDATAVSFQDKSLTYEQLNACANQLAQYLYRLGVGPESLVGVYLARSLEMVIALLGVLKAGAAYMPLDPSYPQSRVVFMLEDSRSSMLLTQQKLAANLLGYSGQFLCLDSDSGEISKEGSENLCHPSEAESLAYVIYTSGS